MSVVSSPALSWLALAAAVLLVPVPAMATVRARGLATRSHRAGARRGTSWLALTRTLGACAAAVVVAVALTGGVVLGAAAAVLALAGARLVADAVRRRRGQRGQRALLAAVRLLVAEIESGARPEAALEAAAEASTEHSSAFGAAARAAADGAEVSPALLDDPALTSLAHAWQVAASAGVPLADVLSGVAADLAARADQDRAVAVALSAARSTAALLAGLPLLGIGLGAAMGARPLEFLLHSSAGRLVCCAGAVLDALGLLWTQRLARRAESP